MHQALVAVDEAEPIGVFILISQSLDAVRDIGGTNLHLDGGRSADLSLLYAGLHHRQVCGFSFFQLADDVVQPEDHIHDHVRRLEQHGYLQQAGKVVILHAAGYREAVVHDACQLTGHVEWCKDVHAHAPVDCCHEDVALHVAVGQVALRDAAVDFLHCQILR